jgi:hypothetical protein
MIETEIEYATALNDEKMLSNTQENFSKILTTVACGCYSGNFEIAELSLKTLERISEDMRSGNALGFKP